jgi:hypothetical protein
MVKMVLAAAGTAVGAGDAVAAVDAVPGFCVSHDGHLALSASLTHMQPGHSHESVLGLNMASDNSSTLFLRPAHGSTACRKKNEIKSAAEIL